MDTIFPIILTATFSYLFAIRQNRKNEEIQFTREIAKEVELIYSEINNLTGQFLTHVNILRGKLDENVSDKTINLTTDIKNSIYTYYTQLKSIEFRLTSYRNYIHAQPYISLLAVDTHKLWERFDYVSNRSQVKAFSIKNKYLVNDFLTDSAALLIRCANYRYLGKYNLFDFINQITIRKSFFRSFFGSKKTSLKSFRNKKRPSLSSSKEENKSIGYDIKDLLLEKTQEYLYDDPEAVQEFEQFLNFLEILKNNQND